jgi:uncharacterized protein
MDSFGSLATHLMVFAPVMPAVLGVAAGAQMHKARVAYLERERQHAKARSDCVEEAYHRLQKLQNAVTHLEHCHKAAAGYCDFEFTDMLEYKEKLDATKRKCSALDAEKKK